LVLAALTGCSNPGSDLSGKVELNGDSLSFGQVSLYDEKGEHVANGRLLNGEYKINGLKNGSYTITVNTYTPFGTPVGLPPMPKLAGDKEHPKEIIEQAVKKHFSPEEQDAIKSIKAVPVKYASPSVSDLKVTINGNTTYDIAMTGKGERPTVNPPKKK